MADPIIYAIFDHALRALNAMGRENGYHRDYSGVIGLPVTPHQEPDLAKPLVQVVIGATAPIRQPGTGMLESAYDSHRPRQEFFVRVNLPPTMRILSGRKIRDLTLPIWQARSDIHKALFVDRTRGASGFCTTYYMGPELPEYFGIDIVNEVEIGGVTVIERYGIEYAHATGDMTTAA